MRYPEVNPSKTCWRRNGYASLYHTLPFHQHRASCRTKEFGSRQLQKQRRGSKKLSRALYNCQKRKKNKREESSNRLQKKKEKREEKKEIKRTSLEIGVSLDIRMEKGYIYIYIMRIFVYFPFPFSLECSECNVHPFFQLHLIVHQTSQFMQINGIQQPNSDFWCLLRASRLFFIC